LTTITINKTETKVGTGGTTITAGKVHTLSTPAVLMTSVGAFPEGGTITTHWASEIINSKRVGVYIDISYTSIIGWETKSTASSPGSTVAVSIIKVIITHITPSSTWSTSLETTMAKSRWITTVINQTEFKSVTDRRTRCTIQTNGFITTAIFSVTSNVLALRETGSGSRAPEIINCEGIGVHTSITDRGTGGCETKSTADEVPGMTLTHTIGTIKPVITDWTIRGGTDTSPEDTTPSRDSPTVSISKVKREPVCSRNAAITV
jgi:hypothetical protein